VKLTRLSSLSVNFIPQLFHERVDASWVRSLTSLRSLSLNCLLLSRSSAPLLQLTSLHSLTLSHCQIGLDLLFSLSSFHHLTSLSIRSCAYAISPGFSMIGQEHFELRLLRPIATLSRLSVLDLEISCSVDCSSLRVLSSLSYLRELCLDKFDLTASSPIPFLPDMVYLRSLSLTASSIGFLQHTPPNSLPNILHLRLFQSGSQITPALEKLASVCPSVRCLSIVQSFKSVSYYPASIFACLRSFSYLEALAVEWGYIADAGVLELARHPTLSRLSLKRVRIASDSVLVSSIDVPFCERLCENITDKRRRFDVCLPFLH
jgi:hypothetical protein